MAKTYYAEGRRIAKGVTGLVILGGLGLYVAVPHLPWWMLFVVIAGSVILGELAGSRWTRRRREAKKAKNSRELSPSASRSLASSGQGEVSLSQTSQAGSRSSKSAPVKPKLTDQDLLRADVQTLSGTDFERLMELYYKDQGYRV
jgi:restriction system protein